MSRSAEELNELKSIIRGLVISSASTMTIRQLESDYRRQEGGSIPYLRYQYPSTEALLRSIPDTVHLREPSHGCPSHMVIVEPVQSKTTSHVEKMVTRQRNTAVRGPKRSSAVSAEYARMAHSNSSRLNGMAPRFIPLALHTSLSRVCQRYSPNGLPLSSLGQELSCDLSITGQEEGGESAFLSKCGFGCVKEVIDAFIDQGIVKIVTRNGQDWVLASNISEPRDQIAADDASYNTRTSSNLSKFELHKTAEFQQASPECEIVPAGTENFSDDGEIVGDGEDVEMLVSSQMKKNFKTLLAMHPNGLWCASLPQEYLGLTGSELDVRRMGFVSVVDMASRLKDVFISVRPDSNSDWLLFDSKSNAIWNSAAAPIGKGNCYPTLPSKYVRKIDALLADCPVGIEKSKFLLAYKDKYNEDFPMVDLGFENLIALLSHLANRGIVHLKFTGNVSMVCRPCKYTVNENEFEKMKKDDDFINALYPLDVVGPHDDIPVQQLPEGVTPCCSLDVQVTHVDSPSKFWFQLHRPEMFDEFNSMMDEMQDFYNYGGPSVHRMPDATIIIGQLCAAKYPACDVESGEWHRARITALPSLSEVEVFYSDYGSSEKCQRSGLRFLSKRFAKIPLQALPGRLTNIRPLGYGLWQKLRDSSHGQLNKMKPSWPSDANKYFVYLIGNKPSVATVSHIRKSDNRVTFGLTDTSKDQDEHLNDILVEKKFAEFGEMSDEEDTDKWEEEELPSSDEPNDHNQSTNDSPLIQTVEPSPDAPWRPVLSDGEHQSPTSDDMSPTRASSSLLSPSNDESHGKSFVEEVEECLVEQSIKDEKREEEHERLKIILEEQRKLEDMRKFEEEEGLEEQIKLQERRESEQKAKEEKTNLDVLLKYELQKLRIQQYLLELQQQQYQMQLLLLASQNGMAPIMPQVMPPVIPQIMPQILPSMLPHPLVRSRVPQCCPPPGLANRLPPSVNGPASISQHLANAVQNNSFIPSVSNSPASLPNFGNVPYSAGAIYPGWDYPGYGNALSVFDGGRGTPSGVGKTEVASPSCFENAATPSNIRKISSEVPSESLRFNSSGLDGSAIPSDSVPFVSHPSYYHQQFNNPVNSVISPAQDLKVPSEVAPLNPSRVSNDNGIPVVKPISQLTIKETMSTISRGYPPSKSDSEVENSSKPSSVLSPAQKDNLNRGSSDRSSVTKANLKSMNTSGDLENSFGESVVQIHSESITNLGTVIESCKIEPHCNQNSSHGTKDDITQSIKLKLGDKREKSDLLEKWAVILEAQSSEESDEDILKGYLNGKGVSVLIIDGAKYVVTEQVLALFFGNLPVHVALRIAKLRPNGNKIKSISLNPRKDWAMCRKVDSLHIIEINPYGSDVHLTHVDTIKFLCHALSTPT